MYNFRDVNQASGINVLPSEALNLNGQYIEEQIPGYRTLSVMGREALSPDVVTFETGIRDGTRLKSKRYPERIITVTYQLIANSNEEFREAYNKLGQILDVKEAKLVFFDEPDKYFIGTPCTIGSVPPGRNAVVGEIEFICTDPFKYSIFEHIARAAPGENGVGVFYNGTYKAYPRLEATFADADKGSGLTGNGDCGYVAFFNEDQKIIQIGDPEEVDSETIPEPSQTIVNQSFLTEQAWDSDAQAVWTVNNGKNVGANIQQMGNVHMGAASYSESPISGRTDGWLLSGAGTCPLYRIYYATKNRRQNSVEVTFTIYAYVDSVETCGITTESEITAAVTIDGKSAIVGIKNAGDRWLSGYEYSVSSTVTVDSLYADVQTQILNNYIHVTVQNAYSSAALPKTSCNPIIIKPYQTAAYANYYLTASEYGSSADSWHGPSITAAIPGGDVTHFTLNYKQKLCIGSESDAINQLGAFQCLVNDSSGVNLAGIRIYKNISGKSATLVFLVRGQQVFSETIDISNGNANMGLDVDSVPAATIIKFGRQFVFKIAGINEIFEDAAATNIAAANVTFMFMQHSTRPALAYNGLYWAKFVKENVNTYRDVPNKFTCNDVVVADCKNAEIYHNGVSSPDLGALGNNWEDFYLKPGINHISFAYSDWVPEEYAPKIRIRYREVFL